MEIITDSFDNLSVNQLYAKISTKNTQLQKSEHKNAIENVSKKDYIEQSLPLAITDDKDFSKVLEKFKQTDAKTKTDEQIHASIGHTTTPISYDYQQGLDNKMYAVGGSVRFDRSIPNAPKAAVFKLDQIQKAAAGVSDSSDAGNAIASQSNLNKILLQLKGEENANQ